VAYREPFRELPVAVAGEGQAATHPPRRVAILILVEIASPSEPTAQLERPSFLCRICLIRRKASSHWYN
jgi:hypothetical protein